MWYSTRHSNMVSQVISLEASQDEKKITVGVSVPNVVPAREH